jgi:hypothetical protein
MCGSKYEREQWERERREAELEAERILWVPIIRFGRVMPRPVTDAVRAPVSDRDS